MGHSQHTERVHTHTLAHTGGDGRSSGSGGRGLRSLTDLLAGIQIRAPAILASRAASPPPRLEALKILSTLQVACANAHVFGVCVCWEVWEGGESEGVWG